MRQADALSSLSVRGKSGTEGRTLHPAGLRGRGGGALADPVIGSTWMTGTRNREVKTEPNFNFTKREE